MKTHHSVFSSLSVSALALATFAGALWLSRPVMPQAGQPEIKYRAPATGPAEAFAWRRLAWRDGNGQIDPNGYRRAVAQRIANAATMNGSAREGGGLSLSWTHRGPGNVGGRTRSLLIDPADRNKMLAGSVGGGLWRTVNGGVTWSAVSDRLDCLAIGSLAADPNNFNTQFAGTGEGQFNGDALGGLGIYRSKDRGLTWTLLPSTTSFNTVNRIAVSPTNGNVILASLRYGGLVRSTDGGNTWNTVRWAQGSFDVQFHPTDGNRAVAQIIDYDGGWFHAAMVSNDGGMTWIEASGLGRIYDFLGRIDLAYAPSSPTTVYATTGQGNGEIWRSTDGGASYALRTATGIRSGANWYACPIWVSPTDPNLVVVGGTHVYRSTDGGTSMARISDGYLLTEQAHPDIHDFIQDPGYNGTTNRKLFVVTDGGVFRTDDITTTRMSSTTWTSLNVGYDTTQFYGAAGHGPTGKVVGGTQDNGTLKTEVGNNTAVLTFGGDGGWCAIDSTNPNYTYGEYVYLYLHRSTNGGESADWMYSGLSDAGSTANFIAPFILDPNAPERLWAGGNRLWRTNDARATPPTWSATTGGNAANISAIAVQPGNSNVVWYGCNDGQIFRTSNALAPSPTWTAVDNNGGTNPLPNSYITRLVFDPLSPSRVYVCLGGWDTANIRVSTNNGSTWADVTGAGASGLPDAPVRGLAVDPSLSGYLYAGTEVGFFASTDGGQTWSSRDTGPANVSVDEVTFMSGSRKLLLATHGRGMWTAEVSANVGLVTGRVVLQDWDFPANVSSTFELRNPADGSVVATRQSTLDADGRYSVQFNAPVGTYDLWIKPSHWLAVRRASVVIGTGGVALGNSSVVNGDVDGDNTVTVFDYDQLSSAFDSVEGGPAWDADADLDGDRSVTVFDFDILTRNFDQSGA